MSATRNRAGRRVRFGSVRHLTAVAATIIALAASMAAPAFVTSNNFGGPLNAGEHCDTTPASQCMADAFGAHNVCIVSLGSTHLTAMEYAIGHYDSFSFGSVYQYSAPCYSFDDVWVQDDNRPDIDAIAWGACISGATYGGSEASHTRWCKPQLITWNTRYNSLLTTGGKRDYVACHELGHTLGLRHWISGEPNPTCMRPATLDPVYIPATYWTSSHDQGELDEHY